KITAALARLSPEDRKLVEAQRFCPILTANRLGVMGPPIKVTIKGQAVFLCCSGCTDKAQTNPDSTLAKVESLKAENAKASAESNKSEGKVETKEEAEIKA